MHGVTPVTGWKMFNHIALNRPEKAVLPRRQQRAPVAGTEIRLTR